MLEEDSVSFVKSIGAAFFTGQVSLVLQGGYLDACKSKLYTCQRTNCFGFAHITLYLTICL